MGRIKQAWLTTIKHTFNPLTLRMARRGIGPFSLIRHVGRRSGATFETPLILARVPDGFVAELTYGAGVNWYRNVVAASHAVVVWHGREYSIDRIGPCPTEDGLRAFGPPASWLLRMLRRHEFRMLRESTAPPAAPSSRPA
ncbi:MAG TPA: nitroreductase family deazaflavin-dependent oxidoreductase [Agromyces mariniharenae]|nr:nitroreductase family deazaflavin-dependent oxidoreductase [Agromyces mariniharenae]